MGKIKAYFSWVKPNMLIRTQWTSWAKSKLIMNTFLFIFAFSVLEGTSNYKWKKRMKNNTFDQNIVHFSNTGNNLVVNHEPFDECTHNSCLWYIDSSTNACKPFYSYFSLKINYHSHILVKQVRVKWILHSRAFEQLWFIPPVFFEKNSFVCSAFSCICSISKYFNFSTNLFYFSIEVIDNKFSNNQYINDFFLRIKWVFIFLFKTQSNFFLQLFYLFYLQFKFLSYTLNHIQI